MPTVWTEPELGGGYLTSAKTEEDTAFIGFIFLWSKETTDKEEKSGNQVGQLQKGRNTMRWQCI